MFGRISKIFKRGTTPAAPSTDNAAAPDNTGGSPFARKNAPSKSTEHTPAAPPAEEAPQEKPKSKKADNKPAKPAEPEKVTDAVKKQWEAKAGEKLNVKEAPEVLCGITPGMSTDEIAEKLATLYRRHNRAASSLDPQMREEAEAMLEAIATAKEKLLPKR
jgi:hypothetical protein